MDPISTAKKNAGLRSLAVTGSLSRGFLGASRRRGDSDSDIWLLLGVAVGCGAVYVHMCTSLCVTV
jgi:hypothetical protein